MHSALTNVDVVYTILSILAGGSSTATFTNPPKSQRSLLHFGLSCKSLLEPAIDKLWSSVTSLVPLAVLLPVITKDGSGNITFGVVKEAHWIRLRYYAQRVRYFSFTGLTLSWPTCAQLSCLHPSPILPNLRGFNCSLAPQVTISEIILILNSPSIEAFTLSWVQNNASMQTLGDQTFFLLSQRQRETLQSLNIMCPITRKTLLDEFAALTSFSTTNPIDPAHLQYLSRNTNLQTLNLVLDNFNGNTNLAKEIFPSLRVLDIGGPASAIYEVLRRISSTSLSQLDVHSSSGDTVDIWNNIAYVIQAKWKSKLGQLRLAPAVRDTLIPPSLQNSGNDFGVNSLKLEGWKGIGPEEISQMCAPFKSLTCLAMNSPQGGNLSWDALGPIHRGLQTLESLSIWMNSHQHSNFTSTSATTTEHPLKHLSVGFHGSIVLSQLNQISVARALDKLFPIAELLSMPGMNYECITAMQSMLVTFKGIRLDEYEKCKCEKCVGAADELTRVLCARENF